MIKLIRFHIWKWLAHDFMENLNAQVVRHQEGVNARLKETSDVRSELSMFMQDSRAQMRTEAQNLTLHQEQRLQELQFLKRIAEALEKQG